MSALNEMGPWLGVVGLGVFHGINPAMGWLLAVALGLQERRRAAVWRALPAIAAGHEASVAVAAGLVGGLRLVAAPDALRVASAVLLLAFGAFKLLRPRAHPRWVGMRLSLRDLVLWSFLMSSAHGAGLMLIPPLLGLPAPTLAHAHAGADAHPHAHDGHVHALVSLGPDAGALLPVAGAALLHTLAMLLTMGLVAGLVYERLGVGVLRRAWLNLDRVWAGAILAAGVFTLLT